MSTDTRSVLEAELEGHTPDGLATLNDEELIDLADRLRSAKQHQSEALQAGIDEALQIVPRVARGSVRKILFG